MENAIGSRERWRKVPGWSAYEVSDQGRVRRAGRLLGGTVDADGYRRAHLSLPGRVKQKRGFHQLVLVAFRGSPRRGQVARHRNGRSTDNRLTNLRWGTTLQNQRDRKRHGTDSRGVRNGRTHLTERQVLQIRRASSTQESIARQFGVCRTTISYIQRRETWRHLD